MFCSTDTAINFEAIIYQHPSRQSAGRGRGDEKEMRATMRDEEPAEVCEGRRRKEADGRRGCKEGATKKTDDIVRIL